MNPKSDTLFHFTRKLEYLTGILESGFIPRHCLEDVKWLGVTPHRFIAYPMVCFCDIPISRIADHTTFYGSYGIGLTKNWGIQKRLTPVFYTSPDSAARRLTDFMFELDFRATKDPGERESQEQQRTARLYDLLSLVKPIRGHMLVGGKSVPKEFYQENEWRFVPEGSSLYFEDEFDSERDAANARMVAHKLGFTLSDIRYVFVREDGEIPTLVDFIDQKMGRHPQDDLKILKTRITSLETISQDL
jgi:hypothetical protein